MAATPVYQDDELQPARQVVDRPELRNLASQAVYRAKTSAQNRVFCGWATAVRTSLRLVSPFG